MATGKSTLGRLAAERLGRRFVDLDDLIEERAGKRIGEIFREEGEEGFRRHEAEALSAVTAETDVVVACGGGAPCFGDNLDRMRAAGIVVALRASLEEILRRAALPGAPVRPLLADAERLYAARQAIYESADVVVATDGRSPDALAEAMALRARLRLGDVAVKLGRRSYPIHLGPLSLAGELVRERIGAGRVAVITDENVARAGHPAALGLDAPILTVPPGEASKSLAEAQ